MKSRSHGWMSYPPGTRRIILILAAVAIALFLLTSIRSLFWSHRTSSALIDGSIPLRDLVNGPDGDNLPSDDTAKSQPGRVVAVDRRDKGKLAAPKSPALKQPNRGGGVVVPSKSAPRKQQVDAAKQVGATIPPTAKKPADSGDLRVQADHVSHITGALYANKRQRRFPVDKVVFRRKPAPVKTATTPSTTACRKWSVVTTIFEASDAVKKQSHLGDGWCMVIVGDRRSPVHFRTDGLRTATTVYLNVTAQEEWAQRSRFVRLLPWNHFGRKNAGYLYAIQHGAEVVWDFDDDNFLKSPALMKVPVLTREYTVLTVREHTFPTLNPYPAMGAPYFPTWPRGLPLDHIRAQACHNFTDRLVTTKIRGVDIGVIQSLADNDPDVDAIMRLTQPLPFRFTTPAANGKRWLVLPRATYTPFNAQATVVMCRSLWMLFLPITVTSRVTDIWRAYIGTRLARDIGQRILFSPPMVDQYRNSHNYLADFESETHLYLRSGALVKLLNAWRPRTTHFAGRIEELWIHLYEYAYIDMLDVQLMQAWLEELLSSGYRFPALIKSNTSVESPP